jgi:hypothetical protein
VYSADGEATRNKMETQKGGNNIRNRTRKDIKKREG